MFSLANPPSSPLAGHAAMPPLGTSTTSNSRLMGGGMVGAPVANIRRPSIADEPVAVHSGGQKGYRTVSRAASQTSIGSAGYNPNPPSSPLAPNAPYSYSFSSPTRLPDHESTAAWKEMGKVVLEEGGKGPRGGWWVEVGSGGWVLRCWTHPTSTPADLKQHLAQLFPSHLECGPHRYRVFFLLPSAHEDDSPTAVELDDHIPLSNVVEEMPGKVQARLRLVYSGGFGPM